MAFNGVGRFSLAPGQALPFNGWTFNNGEDRGAQYFFANPTSNTGSMIVTSDQNKTRSKDGVSYGFTATNKDLKQSVFFDVGGGGFLEGFNGIDSFTIGPLTASTPPLTINGFIFPTVQDRHARYFSANPISDNGSMLVMSDQSKTQSFFPDDRVSITYGFTVRNMDTEHSVTFDVQGGGFIKGFNGIGRGRFSIKPGARLPLNGWTFPNGEDRGTFYFSANPFNLFARLVMSDQNKTRMPDGSVSYGFTVENRTDILTSPDGVFFDVEGGGFV
jgi:invasion protein IalB